MAKAKQTFEEYLEANIRKAAQANSDTAKHMNDLMSSDVGESLVALITSLAASFKDEHVFGGDPERRPELKGSILACNAILSVIVQFAHDYEADPVALGAPQAWAGSEEDEDTADGM